MLRGLPSANRLNTHITHTPSFLISLLCVWVLSQSWRWGTDAARPHVSKCYMKQAQISNTGCELWTNTTEADMQHGMTTKWGFPWKKKKWGDFQCNPFNLFRSGMGGVVVIIPIRVIKTSLCMCQRTAAFLFFCLCTGSPKHQHITNQFPYISLYSHLILSQCWWELEHGSLYTGI